MKYRVTIEVEVVTGSQYFEVEAASPKDAVAKVRNGEGELIGEDLNVESLDWGSAMARKESAK